MEDRITAGKLLRNSRYFLRRLPGIARVLRRLPDTAWQDQHTYPVFFAQQAQRFSEHTLIRYEGTDIRYGEFNAAANRIAHYLMTQGFGRGDTFALLMENRPEFLLYQLAVTKIGASSALINNAQKGDTLIHSINLVDCRAAIVGEERLDVYTEIADQLCVSAPVFVVPDRHTLSDPGPELSGGVNIARASLDSTASNPEAVVHIRGDDPAWYVYTSGTTGLPKASVQTHRRVIKAILTFGNIINPLKPNDVVFSSLPLYHTTALLVCWCSVIHSGAAFALSRKFSASHFWDDVRRYEATVFGYVGELCRYLLNQPPSADDRTHRIRSMTGNGLRPEIWLEFKQRFGIEEVNELYGASESSLVACNLFNLDCTVGKPLTSSALVRVDEETEQPVRDARGRLIKVDVGEPGLLLGEITEALPFDGYSDKSKNSSKIICDAFKDGDRWFNTGDVLRDIGCGQLQFCDRTGDTYRWKGENVSTQEVENVCNAFSQVLEAVAYGVEIPGTNGKAGMVALKVAGGVDQLDTAALYQHLNAQLPGYAVPVFMRLCDELEKTETFKYQKVGLKRAAFDPSQCDGPVYVRLPGREDYEPVTADVFAAIHRGEYRF